MGYTDSFTPPPGTLLTELAPPVRARHTVYVRKLFLLGGQTYCRHHIIPAAVAAGVISEVKAGAGPDLA